MKREYCLRCTRPLRSCICHCIHNVETAIEVLILQDPFEKNHIKGSARLLHLCLPNSKLLIGDYFEETILLDALNGNEKTPILLYPSFNQIEQVEYMDSQREFNIESTSCENIRLIILDATWRKSRQLLTNNPLLQTLDRWSLKNISVSKYEIRQAHQEHQLSTLEACAYALLQLDQMSEKYAPLFLAFDVMIKFQLDFGVNQLKRIK